MVNRTAWPTWPSLTLVDVKDWANQLQPYARGLIPDNRETDENGNHLGE